MDGPRRGGVFASARPVLREDLARVVGANCNLELILDDIRDELRGRPYEIVAVAGGWSFRTRLGFGEAIRAALGGPTKSELSKPNAVVLMAIAYFQPITRGELSQLLGREVSRDAIAALREQGLVAAGPRSPTPGAPTPMSRRRGSWGNSGSKACAICRTSKSCRTPGCSAERAQRHPPGRPSPPSCEGCSASAATERTSAKRGSRSTGARPASPGRAPLLVEQRR